MLHRKDAAEENVEAKRSEVVMMSLSFAHAQNSRISRSPLNLNQSSRMPEGPTLTTGALIGISLGAAGMLFVICMWIFRWSRRSRDNIARTDKAVEKMKGAFGIGGKKEARVYGRREDVRMGKWDREGQGDMRSLPAVVVRGAA